MSAADGAQSSSSAVSKSSRSRKLISDRVSSVFRTKSNQISHFTIDLDDPLHTYAPNSAVNGTVELTVDRPLGLTHITLLLRGHAQVYKNHSKPKAEVPTYNPQPARGRRWVSEYWGDGFLSLFEEEIVLCGEGRLDPKTYHFRFEIDFPRNLQLPSSIDFERGRIRYTVVAILTKAAAIAPTMYCETPVKFNECFDIGTLPAPVAREARLHPTGGPSTTTRSLKKFTSHEYKRASHTSVPTASGQSSIENRNSNHSETAISPPSRQSRSIPSTRSSSSSQNQAFVTFSDTLPSPSGSKSQIDSGIDVQPVTVSTRPLRNGALAGDNLPVLVNIKHNKVVHSAKGILVTLYRQSRVDLHPHLPLATREKNEGKRYEDLYPRSKSGLGGLSLSAAGSSQVWRKDLSQVEAPLYVDPLTMSTEIKVNVKVPDDAFPSIANVPGQMISFRYFIEVIVDAYGRLFGTERGYSTFTMTQNVPHSTRLNAASQRDRDVVESIHSTSWGNNCVDTTEYRRDKKNAVIVYNELIIGMKDSEKKGKQKRIVSDDQTQVSGQEQIHRDGQLQHGQIRQHQTAHQLLSSHDPYRDYGNDWYYPDYENDTGDWHDWSYQNQDSYDHPPPEPYSHHALVPPPNFEDESELSEKERMRRHEISLMPSQPPAADLDDANLEPSAPVLPASDIGTQEERPYDLSNYETQAGSLSEIPDLVSNPNTQASLTDNTQPYAAAVEDHTPSFTGDRRVIDRDELETERTIPAEASSISGQLSAPYVQTAGDVVDGENEAPTGLQRDDGVESIKQGQTFDERKSSARNR